MTFSTWYVDLAFTGWAQRWNTALPWPIWPTSPIAWPGGLTRLLFQALSLFSLLVGAAFLGASSYRRALWGLALLFAAKLFFYIQDLRQVANFHHMHLYFTWFFLLGTGRIYWLRICLATVYWMAAVVKFSPSWLYGEYFYSMPRGLPLLPHNQGFIQAACDALILLEIVGPLCFWSRSQKIRQGAVLAFLLFHLYSGVIVGIWYTTLMIPFLLLLFADGFKQSLRQAPPAGPRLRCVLTLCAMALSSLWPLLIPGDVRLSGEGRYLGLFMFDANHRSRAVIRVEKGRENWEFRLNWTWPSLNHGQTCNIQVLRQGQTVNPEIQSSQGQVFFHPTYFQSLSTRIQNDPYVYFHWARRVQKLIQPTRISIKLWSRLDGHEEEVQTLDIADFERVGRYNPFWHNSWIRLPGPEAPAFYRWY